MSAPKIVLPRLKYTEATLQYYRPRSAPVPYYKNRFVLPPEVKELVSDRKSWLARTDPLMPKYPYGKNQTYPEANLGLYGGQMIRSGNKISAGRNKGKTLRKWFPNVKIEKLRSEALGKTLTLPVTARVKRTIKKCGGLDNYLLGSQPARIKELGLLGWKLRWHVMNSDPVKAKLAQERRQLHPEDQSPLEQSFEQAWADPIRRKQLVQEQTANWEALRQKDLKFKKHWLSLLEGDRSAKTNVKSHSTLFLHDPETLRIEEMEYGVDFTEEKPSRRKAQRGELPAITVQQKSKADELPPVTQMQEMRLGETGVDPGDSKMTSEMHIHTPHIGTHAEIKA